MLGNDFRLTAHRGEELRLVEKADLAADSAVVATPHPSAVLRGPADTREESLASLVSDLRFAAGLLRH